MSNHELIRGDNGYLWGGAMKAFLEDRINIHPAETVEANKEAFAKYPGGEITFTQSQMEDPKEIEKMSKLVEERMSLDKRAHNIREDAAIAQVAQSSEFKSHQIFPLVYGEGHDFKDNIEKFNEESEDDLGLIRIDKRQ